MAIGDAYASAATYRDRIQKSDPGDDATIDLQLLAVSRLLEKMTGRFFTRDVGVVKRTFPVDPLAPNPGILYVTDIATRTGLVVNDGSSVIAATDYQLMPLNAEFGPEAMPWTEIVLQHAISGRSVSVTASWGWPAIPQAVIEATINMTAELRLETPRATTTIDSLGNTEKVSPNAMKIARQIGLVYRRRDVF